MQIMLLKVVSIVVFFIIFFSGVSSIYAQTAEPSASGGTPGETVDLGPGPAGIRQLQELFQRFTNLSVGLAFIAVTGVLVYAAIRFLTSGGDAK